MQPMCDRLLYDCTDSHAYSCSNPFSDFHPDTAAYLISKCHANICDIFADCGSYANTHSSTNSRSDVDIGVSLYWS